MSDGTHPKCDSKKQQQKKCTVLRIGMYILMVFPDWIHVHHSQPFLLKAFANGHVAVATTPFGCQSIRKPTLSGIINQCVWLIKAVFIANGLLIITFHLLTYWVLECSRGTPTNRSTQRTNHPITVGHALNLSRKQRLFFEMPLARPLPQCRGVLKAVLMSLSHVFWGVKSQSKQKKHLII